MKQDDFQTCNSLSADEGGRHSNQGGSRPPCLPMVPGFSRWVFTRIPRQAHTIPHMECEFSRFYKSLLWFWGQTLAQWQSLLANG